MRILDVIALSALFGATKSINKDNIDECARVLGENLQETFQRATAADKITQFYDRFVEEELFDPRLELKRSKAAIENYLQRRAQFAYKAKLSLESRELRNTSEEEINDPNSRNFIRFMSAKAGTDATTIYVHDHSLRKTYVNMTRSFNLSSNANFYNLPTSPLASAVHVPTPHYDRDPDLLRKIEWSEIDAVYRTNREETRDLAFQMFCSESGYMRFFPAASWFWDNHQEHLDLFDCRNTEWYINGATNSKNVLIMLDMSGSMLGQRYEIAKQTTEAILETLSHNDYFNIMPFSKAPYFLDDCGGKAGLIQATMRNKKLLRNKMNNVSSEGKAEYEKALAQAFTTLMNLPEDGYDLLSREELAMLHPNASAHQRRRLDLPEYVLSMEDEYAEAISEYAGGDNGCESVIMLITDGAPDTYLPMFDLYNKDKKIRFFSFLIGEEAIDFQQVKEMACYNRGYMVHVQNMADVEEKVQHYIGVMSRPIGQHHAEIGDDDAFWSGVYRERLYLPRPETFAEPVPITNTSFAVMNKMAARRKIRLKKTEARGRMFVTTVSYAVVLDDRFMGVAAVSVPLTEISQQAHPSNIGQKSYFFMLDHNGFIMFHPQLRPIDPVTKLHKQNYNNMDLIELEVSQTQQVKKMVVSCDNTEPQQMDILFATDMLDRVYPQTNTYYSECIKGADFILGLAVAKGDESRVKARKAIDYGKIKLSWIDGNQWRVHPYWRYCLLNDTDTNMSKEEAFVVYVEQMHKSGKLPDLCRPRQQMVEKLLLDLEATEGLAATWEMQWQFLKENLMHLVFFASPSGMIRFYNQTLDNYDYEDPRWRITDFLGLLMTDDTFKESYNHFIVDVNRKSVDDKYYKRAVRLRDQIVFDVYNTSKLWYRTADSLSAYGNTENVTVLASAAKAVYKGNAVLGVTGVEFAFDWLVATMSEHGCQPDGEKKWCLLLDEHGYVFYSNQKTTKYDQLFDEFEGETVIGKWFGRLNRISQRTMQLLVENKFYTKMKYVDHQAICKEKKVVSMAASTSSSVFRWFSRLLQRVFLSLHNLSLLPFFHSFVKPADAYTASFHDGSEGFPCSKTSYFYLANHNSTRRPKSSHLIDGERLERPCKTSKCAVQYSAAFVEGTNLVMVWIKQGDKSQHCYDDTQCPKADENPVPFGFVAPANVSSVMTSAEPLEERCTVEATHRHRTKQQICYSAIHDESHLPCSPAAILSLLVPLTAALLL